MRGRFFWRIGCFFAVFFALTVVASTVAVWLTLTALGVMGRGDPGHPPPGPAFLLLLLLGAIAVAIVARGVRRLAAPVGDLIEAAGRVEAGDYTARVPERGPREVRALARAFNSMIARLEANEAQRRRLLADVTHELRTPLAVVQGNLEALVDGVRPTDHAHLAAILDETRVLSRLVDDLRTLSLTESGVLTLRREPTDLTVLVTDVASSFQSQAEAAGVGMTVDVDDEVPLVEIDPVRTREVISNLVANALRYTPRGGTIRIRGEVSRSGDGVTVTVSDTGTGIAPDALPLIFERFYKSPDSRGTGLGLAVAKNLVAAHGGQIEAESAEGRGTTIRFTLPLGTP